MWPAAALPEILMRSGPMHVLSMVLLFGGDGRRDAALMDRVRDAFTGLPFMPTLLCIAPDTDTHERMGGMAQAAGIRYLNMGVMSPSDCASIWHVVSEHLRHVGPPPSSVWAVPEPRFA